MKAQGPLVTLLVGVTTAGVLVGLSTIAKSDDDKARQKAAAAVAPQAAPSSAAPDEPDATATPDAGAPELNPSVPAAPPSPPAPTAAPELSPSPPAAALGKKTRATYAGKVNGASATIAIAVRGGSAIAYLCDGRRTEVWLRGTAAGGRLALTGPGNASLTGRYAPGAAAGSVTARGKRWSFTAPLAKAPAPPLDAVNVT